MSEFHLALKIGMWLLIAAYLAAGVPVWRRAAGELAWGWKLDHHRKPDGFQIGCAIFFGGFVALLWPIYLLIRRTQCGSFCIPPAEVRERIANERIRELERQAGIR